MSSGRACRPSAACLSRAARRKASIPSGVKSREERSSLRRSEKSNVLFSSGRATFSTSILIGRTPRAPLRETALTTDVQLLLDPALNPQDDSIWVLGLRLRIAL